MVKLTSLVELVWIREASFFKNGNITTKDPIKTVQLYWLKENIPDVYEIYKKRSIGLSYFPKLRVMDILNKEQKALARDADILFRQELVKTDLGLLYFRHNRYQDYTTYLSNSPAPLNLYGWNWDWDNVLSLEDLVDLHLILKNVDKAQYFQRQIYIRDITPETLGNICGMFNNTRVVVKNYQNRFHKKRLLTRKTRKITRIDFEKHQEVPEGEAEPRVFSSEKKKL